MPNNDEAEWLREARLIDQLVREELRRRGLPVVDKSFDELVASGAFKAAECQVLSKYMVTPDWLDRASPEGSDVP